MAISPLSNFKMLQYNAISRGRPGFPKPPSQPTRLGLSGRARQVSQGILISGAQLLSMLSVLNESNIDSTKTSILALRSRLTNEKVTLSSQRPKPLDVPGGSLLDKTA